MSLKWFDGVKKRPSIIGFCGFTRSGKNTAAEMLTRIIYDTFDIDRIGHVAFADPIKMNLAPLIEHCRNKGYETNTPEFKEKFRPMYVEWSRVYKNITGNHKIWCDIAMTRIKLLSTPLTMITDVRYDYEIEEINNNNGVVIYIDRPGYDPANSEEESSFTEIYNRFQSSFDGDGKDLIIVKNNGTPLDLGVRCFETLRMKGII